MNAILLCERGDAEAENAVIRTALAILRKRLERPAPPVRRLGDLGDYLSLTLAAETQRVLCAAWLNRRREVLWCGPLFRGDVNWCTTYPRELVREALNHNAAMAVLAISDPADPSRPDDPTVGQFGAMRDALALIGIPVVDSLVITPTKRISLVDMDLMR